MIPFSFGYACSSDWVCFAESVGLSFPYAILTSVMFLYAFFFSSSFMNLIQVFWFPEVGVAERMANWPLKCICDAIHFTWYAPMPLFVVGATKIVRASG